MTAWVRNPLIGGLVILASVLAGAGVAAAAPGDLDPSFGGGDGFQTLGVTPTGSDHGTDVAVQPDGKILVAGYSDSDPGATSNSDFVLVRFDAAGNPDPSFGGGDGIVTTEISPVAGGIDSGLAIALARDGSGAIFVAGQSYVDAGQVDGNFAVAKYTSTGALDNSFSSDGKVTTPVAPTTNVDAAWSVFVQPDGQVVAAGLADMDPGMGADFDFALVRYKTDGTLDETFDGDGGAGNGIVTTPISPAAGSDVALSVTGAPGAKIVCAGFASVGGATGNDGAVVRYLSDGKRDTAFDTDGIRTQAIGPGTNSDSFEDAAVQADGRILAVGSARVAAGETDGQFALVRFNDNGSPDPSFSADGIQTAGIAPSLGADAAQAVALEPGGRIVAGGTSVMAPHTGRYTLARFNADGALDTSFAPPAGITSTAVPSSDSDQITGLDLQSDGAIVAVGDSYLPTVTQEISVARYLGAPTRGNTRPDSNINRISKAVRTATLSTATLSRRRASKPRRFTGTASDDSRVARVEIALARAGRGTGKLARKRTKRCTWLTRKSRLKRTAARRGSCKQHWLRAQGTSKWRFKLRRRLPKGRYVLYSRAIDDAGLAEGSFSRADRNRVTFRVR